MLLGRGPERAAIDRLIRGASQGASGALVLIGDPGAGKSALLKDAADSAPGMTVVRARGIEAESSLPFAALADLLRPMIPQIDGLPPVQSASLRAALAIGPPLPGDRFTTYVAGLNLLALFAETQPILVIVDDLQWIDPESAEALFFAARRLSAERVAMLFAARNSTDLPADPAALPALHLGGLDHEASLLLLSRSTPAIATSVAQTIWRASGGNPLALTEIPGLLSERQLRGHDPLPDPLPVGNKLVTAYQLRLERLPSPARAALLLAAASDDGDLGPISAAATLAGVDPRSALGAAEDAGLIELDGSLLFRHPLIRSAGYEAATPEARRNAHRLLAEALPAEAAARRAWHRAAASLGPDESVASELEAVASDQRVRRAYAAAFHAFSPAAELPPEAPHRGRRLRESATNALVSGRRASAVAQYDRALALVADPVAHADLVLRRGQIAMWLWNPMTIHRSIVAEADQIAHIDPRKSALLLIHAAGPCYMAAEILEGKRTAERALALARTSGDSMTIAAAEVALAEVIVLHGEGGPTATMLRELLPRLAAADPNIANSAASLYGPYSQMCAEDFEPALSSIHAEITRYRSAGALSLLPYPLEVLSELDFRTGRWLSGYANASESVRLARETGAENTSTYSLVCVARFEATTGRDDGCRTHLQEAWTLAERFESGSIFSYVLMIKGLLAVGREQWAAARDSLEQLRRTCQRQEMREPGLLRFNADLIEACVRLGDRQSAEQVLAELEEQAAATGERFHRETPVAGATLTPQELQVSLTVARGFTNKEVAAHLFLSEKTIETHLGNAYGKLGVRSRTELTRLFAVEPERAVAAR